MHSKFPRLTIILWCMAAMLSGYSLMPEASAQPLSVASPVVREGEFAISLARALALGEPSSDADAESMLGAAGIAPRNGWIADYPVTPDILGELRDSISYAVLSKTLPLDKRAALSELEKVKAELNVQATPGTVESAPPDQLPGEETPADETISDYYNDEGPPVVTYYPPPQDYFGYYAWVPYPFWWGGFNFSGFYILRDFHRHVRVNGRTETLSNHYNDPKVHKMHRVDPVQRASGKTFAGIGAPRSRNFISTGVPQAPKRIFNERRTSGAGTGPGRPGVQQNELQGPQPNKPSRNNAANPFHADKVYSSPPAGSRQTGPAPHSSGGSGGGHGAGAREWLR